MVCVGLVMACRLAMWPTRRSPFFANATTDGVVRSPSGVVTTVGSPSWMKEMHELVVPRSIPMTFDIVRLLALEVAPHGPRLGGVRELNLSLIHISEPTRLLSISYAVFC